MVDVFHGVAFPVGRVARKPRGQRVLAPGSAAPVDPGPWTRTSESRPTDVPGGQVDVLFGSLDWGWAIVGLYTHWSDDEVAKGAHRWSMYDQDKDRYVDYFRPGEPEPEFWMVKPQLPAAAGPSATSPTNLKEGTPMAAGLKPVSTEDAARTIGELQGQLARVTVEVEDLRQEPWPKWAETMLAKFRSYGVDVEDEIDLADHFDEHLSEIERAIKAEYAPAARHLNAANLEITREEVEDLVDVLEKAGNGLDAKPRGDAESLDRAARLVRLRRRLEAFDEAASA